MTKTCPICKTKFTAGNKGKIYCSEKCKAIQKKQREKQYWIDVAKGRRKRKLQGPRRERVFVTDSKKRKCLKCDSIFQSTGPDNRICPRCTAKNQAYLRHNGDQAIFNPITVSL